LPRSAAVSKKFISVRNCVIMFPCFLGQLLQLYILLGTRINS
jgi:hypothetical protein